MQIGFIEDFKKPQIQKKAIEPQEQLQTTKAEQTRAMIMTYLLMGVKPSAIAKSMGLSRQYIYRFTKDCSVLRYILQGTMTASDIARLLGIKETEVIGVMQRYQTFISHNS